MTHEMDQLLQNVYAEITCKLCKLPTDKLAPNGYAFLLFLQIKAIVPISPVQIC